MFDKKRTKHIRHKTNIELLSKYQQDIDALSCIFNESKLYNLMTELNVHDRRVMKIITKPINLISPTAAHSNQINKFQDTKTLLSWIDCFSNESSSLALNIYSSHNNPISKSPTRNNRLHSALIKTLDEFIENEFTTPYCKVSGTKPFFNAYLKLMSNSLRYSKPFNVYPSGNVVARKHTYMVDRYAKRIIHFLNSSAWLNSLPKYEQISPNGMSNLVFAYFCSKYLKDATSNLISEMKANNCIHNTFLHPKMLSIITLIMAVYDAICSINNDHNYNQPLTSPDVFIFGDLTPGSRANMSGFYKTQEQLLHKTYIYIALLLNPSWGPCAKEICKLLDGEHKTIQGGIIFERTGAKNDEKALRTKINNVSLMSNERYFEKFLAAFDLTHVMWTQP